MQTSPTRVAQVFWGLAIVGVDLHVGRFDLVPDVVGYVLIALGVAGLGGWSNHFQLVRLLSWALVPGSVLLMVFQGVLLKLSWVLCMGLEAALMWFLLGGLMEFTDSKMQPERTMRMSICRRVYVGLLGAGLFILWLAPELPTLARILGSTTRVGMLAVLAVVLHLLYQLKQEALTDNQPEEVKEAA